MERHLKGKKRPRRSNSNSSSYNNSSDDNLVSKAPAIGQKFESAENNVNGTKAGPDQQVRKSNRSMSFGNSDNSGNESSSGLELIEKYRENSRKNGKKPVSPLNKQAFEKIKMGDAKLLKKQQTQLFDSMRNIGRGVNNNLDANTSNNQNIFSRANPSVTPSPGKKTRSADLNDST